MANLSFSNGLYSGDVVNGQPNGYGVFSYTNGDKYTGIWVNGVYAGNGTYTWADGTTLTGIFANNDPLSGTQIYKSGNKYIGTFINWLRDGEGTYTFATGEKYVGSFSKGVYAGNGSYTFTSGATIVGAFANNAPLTGTYTSTSSQKYTGQFVDWLFEGQGTYSWPNGQKYVGSWLSGKYNGSGTLTFSDGRVWSGTWKDDELSASSYAISANQSSVNEGGTATFKIVVTNYKSGEPLSYSLGGVSAQDINGGNLSGTASIRPDGTSVISIPISADNTTEGNETLTLTVEGMTASTTIVDTSQSVQSVSTGKLPQINSLEFSGGKYPNVGGLVVNDGVLYLAGSLSGSGFGLTTSGWSDAYLASVDLSTSKMKWARLLGSEAGSAADLAVSGKGEIYIVGYSDWGVTGFLDDQKYNGGKRDAFLSKYNSDGTRLWSRLFDTGPFPDYASKIFIDQNNNIIISGVTEGGAFKNGSFLGGYRDGFLVAYDNAGSFLWSKAFDDEIIDFKVSIQGNYYILQSKRIIVLDSSFRELNVIQKTESSYGSLLVDNSGYIFYSDGQRNLYKVDSSGNLIWNITSIESGKLDSYSSGPHSKLSFDLSGNILSIGVFLDSANRSQSIIQTISPDGKILTKNTNEFSGVLSNLGYYTAEPVEVTISSLGKVWVGGYQNSSILLKQYDSISLPTYSVSANQSSINEGSTATFTVSTTNVTSGTSLAYTLSGVSASDIVGGSLSGTTTVGSKGQAMISVPIAADQTTEGNETLTVTFQGKTDSTTISDTSTTPVVPTYLVSANQSSVNEGSTATFTVSTTNVASGTSLAYTLSGVSASDITGGSLSGTTTVGSSGQATILIPIAADQTTEGIETLILTVQGKSASTTIIDSSTASTFSNSITALDRLSAIAVSMDPYVPTVTGYRANFYAAISGSLPVGDQLVVHRLSAFAGSVYDIFAASSLDPRFLGIFDKDGILVALNNELQDPPTGRYSDGSTYETDSIYSWSPRTDGDYYIAVRYSQSNLDPFAILQIYEERKLTQTYSLTNIQTSLDEGSVASFSVETTNVTAGTSLSYTLSGVTASDVVGGSLTGTTVVGANGKASISVPIAADLTTEGAETLTLTLQGKSASITINDTSITPTVTDFRDVTALQDSSGHFLFTGNATEAEIMQQFGWKQATGLKAFETVDHPAGVTLHKFYYPPTNSFYYATDDQAKAVKAAFTGWVYQGATDMKVFTEAQLKSGVAPKESVPIYQMWVNGTGHVYTTDTKLVDALMGQDINTDLLTANNVATSKGTYNGVVFWGDPVGNNTSGSLSSTTSSSTEYRFVTALQDKEGHFLFTANQTEADIMQQFGWSVAAGVKGFESADTASGVTLHKFYYPPTNSFYYATDDQAKAVKASFTGWDYQGATDLKVYTNTSYAAGKAPTGSVPIYQMWVNGKGHVYTTDTVLVDQLMGQDINTNVLTANNVATANGTYNGVVFWGDPTTKTPVVPVDTTPPTVSSIQITGVDSNNVAKSGALVQGNRVKVVLTMSEATAVIGTPSFTIDVGGSTKTAQYASGSGSNALTFYYAVEAGDLDSTGGITTLANALTLPSGSSIKDSAGNNATLSIASVASGTNAISVDTIAPTVRSYSPTPGATNVAIGSNFVFTFSEAIKKGSGVILLLDARGSVVESFNVLTSSRLTWASNTLTIDPSSDLSINQLYRFEIPAGAIDDEAGNDYAGTSTYTITTVGEAGPPPGF